MTPPVLASRVAVVTGARRGIGAAIAGALLDAGATVVVCGRRADQVGAAVAELAARGNAVPFAGDLADAGERARLPGAAGPVDILVNNAGGFVRAATTLDCAPEEWSEQLAANLTLPFLLSQAVLPGMIARGYGRIVNIGSVVAAAAQPGNSIAYVAAKAGLVGLTRQMAAEVAGSGVTVNAVNPGTVHTEHLDQYFAASPGIGPEDLAARIPLGRLGWPEEIAGVVPFLASPAGAYTTGAVIDINGGAVHA